MSEKGTYFQLDLEEWEQVTGERGDKKGKNPVISPNGTVYADKNRVGEEVRLFVRRKKQEEKQ